MKGKPGIHEAEAVCHEFRQAGGQITTETHRPGQRKTQDPETTYLGCMCEFQASLN